MEEQVIVQTYPEWRLQRLYLEKRNNRMLVKSLYHNSPEHRAKLQYEFSLFSQKANPWLLKLIAMDYIDEQYSIIYENFDGISLTDFAHQHLTIHQFLQIALELVNSCIHLHQSQMLFLAFNSSQILIHPASCKLKLISSHMSSPYDVETAIVMDTLQPDNPQLAYYAPEQTGRLNITVDYRTDLYALGVIFYELICGQLPFATDDTADLLYAILTKKPAPLTTIPTVVWKVIEKLLAKSPDARYQSAVGLKEDLLLIQQKLMTDEPLADFLLGTEDISLQPTLSTKLYGRQPQIEQLVQHFQRVVDGHKMFLVITGNAGLGKSQLAYEIKGEVAAVKGYFIETRYNQLQLENDMMLVIQPLRELLKQVYIEGERSVKQWCSLCEEVQLYVTKQLVELLPELTWFYDAGDTLPSISYEDTKQLQVYMSMSIQKILQTFSIRKTPIVWLIDNLHWAEPSALKFVTEIYEQHRTGYFMVLATSRMTGKEVTLPAHQRIDLPLLQEADIELWLQESLHMRSQTVQELAQHLLNMTQGNPLFIKEVFRASQQDQTIYFDVEMKEWQFNLKQFNQSFLSGEIVTFLENRLANIDQEALKVLQMAACFDRQFTFGQFRQLVSLSDAKLLNLLDILVIQGFLIPLDSQFKWASQLEQEATTYIYSLPFQFVHDRIQQIAYEGLATDERLRCHYRIGQLFSADLANHHQLNDAVKHFNYSISLLNLEEKQQLALWNYELGVNAKRGGFFENALYFLTMSLSLLPVDHWQTMREQAMAIYANLGECECLVGQYELADGHLAEALLHAHTLLEQLEIYHLKTLLYMESDSPTIGIEAGLAGFAAANMAIAENPSKMHVFKEYVQLKMALRHQTDETLVMSAPIQQAEIEKVIQIAINMAANTIRLNPNLTGLLLMRAFRLQLAYGGGTKTGIIFSNYAMLLNAGFGDIKQATRFGKLAIEAAEQQDNRMTKGHVYYVYGLFICHWTNTYETSIYYMSNAQKYCIEVGLYLIVTTASCFIVVAQILRGATLADIQQEIIQQQNHFSTNASALTIDFLAEMALWMDVLQEPTHPIDWACPITTQDQPIIHMMHYAIRLQMSFLLGDEQQGVAILSVLKQIDKEVFTLPVTTLYYVYRALWQFEWLRHKKDTQLLADIRHSLRQLRKWAHFAPHNYEHLYTLLLAEKYRWKKLYHQAALHYDRAIQLATLRGFTQDVAVANERAANYYKTCGDEQKAQYYSKQAIMYMRAWGAETVAKRWEQLYKHIQIPSKQTQLSAYTTFEMLTVIETTQSLAKEIRMEDLLRNILFSLLKHATANIGYFIHKQQQELMVLALAKADNRQFSLYHRQPIGQFGENMQSVVRYVWQSGEPLIIHNAQEPNALFHEASTAKSILCLPIHHKDDIIAMLYLENTLTTNAFQETQVDLLKMIATQIAVSIENAMMYEELEQRVQARTKELDEMNQHLKMVNERLAKNELERKKLLHSISHELRSPITSTLGYIDLILDGVIVEADEKAKYLTRSRERLLALNLLIQDLFDLANLEAGRADYQFTSVKAYELFSQVEYRYEHEMQQRGLSYRAHFYGNEEARLLLDRTRIQQVIDNMMQNAMKYTNAGTIELLMYVKDQQFTCTIQDSGIGIPVNDLPFVFDSYYRASNVDKQESHGIGLAICKEIVKQHHGHIHVESVENEGSIFHFTLPIVQEK
ncbi:ATP-binding protein [Lysinibacillus piscis]|uniref:histidine kinase n=1 Tax=Lysinibacillus piscis TaxID=2518931 RepID=A0ABQ5NME4_9BACI|nr:ATP-binding protein [Lysinibacillus sp. KH24]GLC89286.1 serine/threonine protein kinase [Lysinibacillus sp. KH24]